MRSAPSRRSESEGEAVIYELQGVEAPSEVSAPHFGVTADFCFAMSRCSPRLLLKPPNQIFSPNASVPSPSRLPPVAIFRALVDWSASAALGPFAVPRNT